MANIISAQDLNALLHGKSKFALIDVREGGEYNSSHLADSSLIPRKELGCCRQAGWDRWLSPFHDIIMHEPTPAELGR